MNRNEKGLITLFVAIMLSMHGFSQVVGRGMEIGQDVPRTFWKYRLQNHRAAAISDFRDTLIVLDFWAAWCTPCVSGLPVMDSLQQTLPGILFVLVNDPDSQDTPSRIRSVTGRYKLAHFKGDQALSLWFVHQQIPHYVWINKGKYLGATGKLTADLIELVLQTGALPKRSLKYDLVSP